MKVSVLVENSKGSNNLKAAHGLAFLIEIDSYKILFDTGPSGLIIRNSKMMGINLTEIDSVVISHGHKDHSGGLRSFRKINDRAVVFIHEVSKSKFRYRLSRLVSIPIFNRKLHYRSSRLNPINVIRTSVAINQYCTIFCNFERAGSKPASNKNKIFRLCFRRLSFI